MPPFNRLSPAQPFQEPQVAPFDVNGAPAGGYAARLAAARTITASGDAAWSVSFDGSANVSAALTLATVNANTGTFGGATTSAQISVNGKGLITGVSAITITPAFSSITGKPTTLAGYGITDAQGLSALLTAYAGAAWSAGVQVPTLTAANTVTLKTVGSATGNLLDKAAGDALYLAIGGTAAAATKLATGRTIAMTGDVTWTSPAFDGTGNVTAAGTLATVNATTGAFGSATQVATFTVNGKGLTTLAGNVTITPAASSITGGQALTKTDDTNVTLTLGGTPATALLQAASLTLGWTGQLGVTRGGTGLAAATLGDMIYGSAANTLSRLTGNITSARQFLTQTGTGTVSSAPAWAAIAATDMPALTGGDVTSSAGSGTLTIGANKVTNAMIRQGAALSVIGVTGNATANVADIAAASDGQVLRRSGTALAFGAVSLSTAAAITGTLPVANGGTGTTTSTGTGNVVLSASPTFTGSPVLPSPSATALTLINSVTNVGGAYATAAWRKSADGKVAVEGWLQGAGGTSPLQITTLPVGARPLANQTFPCVNFASGAPFAGMFEVQATGGVFWYSSNTSAAFSISGINFQT